MGDNRKGSTIHLAPYNPEWPVTFSQLARQIHEALGDRALLLEHVGSTAVPGLSAKPVIDVILAVQSSADEASYIPSLEAAGYALKFREPNWFEHRLLKAPGIATNIHVFSAGCEEITRMLAFRDWLRAHEDDRRLYEQTKRDLAMRSWRRVQEYADAKSEIVSAILTRALDSAATKPRCRESAL